MQRVVAHPAAGGVGALAGGAQQDPEGALAAALHLAVGGLQEDGEVTGEPVGVGVGDMAEAVEVRGDLFLVVEDEGQVAVGRRDRGSHPQLDGDPGLHVAGAAAPQHAVLVQPGGDVAGDRHGVEVSGEHHPLVAAQVRTGHDVVAVAVDGQVREGAQRVLDGVGEILLVAALGGEVDELRGECGGVEREVEGGVVCGALHGSDPIAALQYGGPVSTPSSAPRRRSRLWRTTAAVAVLIGLAGYLAVQYVTGGPGAPQCTVRAEGDAQPYELSPEQAANAATISAVASSRGLSERAVTIALATAMQESGLRNIDFGDRDSVGLFQQRPSQDWGTVRQIMDPVYSAGAFYRHLAKVPGYPGCR